MSVLCLVYVRVFLSWYPDGNNQWFLGHLLVAKGQTSQPLELCGYKCMCARDFLWSPLRKSLCQLGYTTEKFASPPHDGPCAPVVWKLVFPARINSRRFPCKWQLFFVLENCFFQTLVEPLPQTMSIVLIFAIDGPTRYPPANSIYFTAGNEVPLCT